VIVNIIWANVFAILVLVIAIAIFGVPFYLLWNNNIVLISNPTVQEWMINFVVKFAIFLPGIVLHELIHGLFASIFAKNKFKSVKFGIMPARKLFSPYCHCKEKLRINHYRIVAIMPMIIQGIIPAIISIIIGSTDLLFWGILFIVAGAGDILIFLKTLKEKKDSWLFDHPSEAGYYIYRKK
jgi:hypothetical protein